MIGLLSMLIGIAMLCIGGSQNAEKSLPALAACSLQHSLSLNCHMEEFITHSECDAAT